ncbi:hypothetical protein AnigIFM59636_000188 [Aspergillus niger]|nr:hypothetical protein AnigIFM59636_000188 [Aspergillus niger]
MLHEQQQQQQQKVLGIIDAPVGNLRQSPQLSDNQIISAMDKSQATSQYCGMSLSHSQVAKFVAGLVSPT